jgi:hypothetical protein
MLQPTLCSQARDKKLPMPKLILQSLQVNIRGGRLSITVSPADRRRLLALVKDRNAPQKHVWRAEIVLLSAGGAGTNAIMRQTGKSKTWGRRPHAESFSGQRWHQIRQAR